MRLQGRKSYITAVLVGGVVVARYLGYLTPEVYELLLGLLGASGLATLRAGMAKC
jgi:hypothetical protein